MGKSKPQDALMRKLENLYPDAFINDEVYIGNLIEECGYTQDEIADELGSKVHKMFVDIIMHDCDRIVAFEYHGEQHYSLVGNMTKTTADLMLNQQLDREKSWILTRIGIPLVTVPYDMYIDDMIIENMIDEAYNEVALMRNELSECPMCQRFFPVSKLPFGVCSKCHKQNMEQEAYEKQQEEEAWIDEYQDHRWHRRKQQETREEKLQRRKEARSKRKAAYQAYKNTPEYKQKKDAEKQRRKEHNIRQREQRKQQRKQRTQNSDAD